MDNAIQVSPKKKNNWFGKIETREEAIKIIKDCSYGFFSLAVLQAVIGFALGVSLWLDAILYFILGGILLKFKSRVAAILLLLLTSGALAMTFINKINPGPASEAGGTNLFLAVMMIWVSVRAIQATFRLRKFQ